MPRDGSGIYSRPPGTDAVSDTSIESTKYNGNVADVEADLNAPRPIIAGGTGATSAAGARDNLDAEAAGVTITNYDSHVWECGSFWSQPGATGAPNPTGWFAGVSIVLNNDQGAVVITARDQVTRVQYQRTKTSGIWSGWVIEASDKVSKAGDTMNGDLSISKVNPLLFLNKGALGQSASILGGVAGLARWSITLGDTTPTTGANTDSHFVVNRYNDSGASVGTPIAISRTTGNTILSGTGTGMATLQVNYSYWGILTQPTADNFSAIVFNNASGSVIGSINNTSTSTSYATSSDDRLKSDLQEFNAGSIIDDTRVYSFKWRSTGERSYGVSAQQANDVYPEAVSYLKDQDWWGIDYSKYVPVILQELKALRARVAELEGRLEAGAQPA